MMGPFISQALRSKRIRRATATKRAAAYNRAAVEINKILGVSLPFHDRQNKPTERVAI